MCEQRKCQKQCMNKMQLFVHAIRCLSLTMESTSLENPGYLEFEMSRWSVLEFNPYYWKLIRIVTTARAFGLSFSSVIRRPANS